jgi:S1-C subfamily serine protease
MWHRNETIGGRGLKHLMLSLIALTAVMAAATHNICAQASANVSDGILNSIVTIVVVDDGQAREIGSGVIVRSDGLIVTAYHLVKDARAIQVRLRNGETFDRAELVANDERRNIAILRIPAAGLSPILSYSVEEGLVGSPVFLISNASETGRSTTGVLSAVVLSDEIPGASRGYRALKFTAPASANSIGGLLVDDKERVLGIVVPTPQSQMLNYAVPFSSVIGLARSVGVHPVSVFPAAAASVTPVPIPQNSVLVPQRPVLPLEARGPGSVVVKPTRPVDVLLASKTIYIASETAFFKPDHLVNALKKRAEIEQWGLIFVDDPRVADLVLTLDHVDLTWKFTFSLAHQRTGVIVATGNVIIWDGNLGAGKMASRVIEKLNTVRAQRIQK